MTGGPADPVLGDLVLTGYCTDGFPVTPDAFDPTWNGLGDAFVRRIVLMP